MMNVAAEISTQSVAAVRALQEYGQKKQSKMLFPESDSSVFLVVKYKKIPMSAEDGKRLFIQLPHSDRSPSNTTICLILPDLDKSMKAARDPDVDRQAREWAERLREKYGITAGQDYAKIFTFKQLQREYSMKPDRAKLAKTYDIFLVDRKLMKMAFNFMGKHFKQITKMPLPINSHQNFANKIREAYSTTQMTLAPLKDTVTIRIGNLGQPLAHLEANLLPVVHSLIEHCPGGAVNIRSCQILSMKTSLPVFVDFGSSNEVKLKEPKARVYPEEVDECTTLPDGLAVKVRADGKVTTVEAKTGKEVLYPTEDDEWEKTDDIKPLSKEMLEKLLLKTQMKKKRQEATAASTGEKKSSVVKGKKRKLDDANDCKSGAKQERIEEEPKPEEQEQNAVDEPNLKQIEEPSVKKQRKRKGSAHGEGEEEGIETGGGAESKEGQAAAGNPDSPSKRRMLKKRKRRQ